jgi:hypothetical protein
MRIRPHEKGAIRAGSAVVAGLLLLVGVVTDSDFQREQTEEYLVVYYFAATDFGFCTASENIEKIKKIKVDLTTKTKSQRLKFVMVALDENIEDGLKLINKYGTWDEISAGSRFRNELALAHLNRSEIPVVPHLLVFKEVISAGKWNIPVVLRRERLADLAGSEQIAGWMEKGCSLPYINAREDE